VPQLAKALGTEAETELRSANGLIITGRCSQAGMFAVSFATGKRAQVAKRGGARFIEQTRTALG